MRPKYLYCFLLTLMIIGAHESAFGQLRGKTQELLNRGFELNSSGRYDSAILYLNEAKIGLLAQDNFSQVIGCITAVAESHMYMGRFKQSLASCDLADSLMITWNLSDTEQKSRIINFRGSNYFFQGDYETARKFYEAAFSLKRQAGIDRDESFAGLCINIGVCYEQMGWVDKAIEWIQKGITILEDEGLTNSRFLGFGYGNLGNNFEHKGDYEQALIFQRKALALIIQQLGEDHPRTGSSYHNLAKILWQKKEYEVALPMYQKALSIKISRLGEIHPNVALTYWDMGSLYAEMRNYDSALFYNQLAKEIYQQVFYDKHPAVADVNNDAGEIYVDLGEINRALSLYEEAYQCYLTYYPPGHPTFLENWANKARAYTALDNYAEALTCYQRGLMVADSGLSKKWSAHPKITQFRNPYSLLSVLAGKAEVAYLYSQNQEDPHSLIKTAWETVQLADKLIDSLRVGFLGNNSREKLAESARKFYEIGSVLAYHQYQESGDEYFLDEILQFFEKSRSLLLLEAIKTSQAREFAGVDPTLSELEKQLAIQRTWYEQKVYEATTGGNPADSIIALSLRIKIGDIKQRQDSLKLELKKNNPNYFGLVYETPLVSREVMQKELDTDQAWVSYFVGDASLFIYALTSQNQWVYQKRIDQGFIEELFQLREGIILQNGDNNQFPIFTKRSSRLYEVLLGEFMNELPEEIQHLIIVPDKELNFLPFELLLEDSRGNHWGDLSYLFRRFRISYASSGSVLLEQSKERKTKTGGKLFGGFAASYEPMNVADANIERSLGLENVYLPLPGAVEEVDVLSELWGGVSFTGKEANEKVFKSRSADFQILHLAMHTLVRDDKPLFSQLVFTQDSSSTEDGLLTAAELYNIELNAQLAVLSACNTGVGQLSDGEGVMSLSRAFAYAGCPSMVMSLWKVPDAATSELMLSFHQELRQGKSKEEALRNAKITYLESNAIPELQHPYFWAGFIAMGDMSPIEHNTSANWMMIGLVFLLVLGLLIGFRRRIVRLFRA